MSALGAAVAVLAAIVLLQLVVTFGLVQRIRLIQETAQFEPADEETAVGRVVGEFRATDTEGRPVSDADFRTGAGLVGFFSSGCPTCAGIVDRLAADPPAEPFVAFVADGLGPERTARLVEPLSAFARIAVIDTANHAPDAFGVVAFPTLMRVQRGVVVAAGGKLRSVGLDRRRTPA